MRGLGDTLISCCLDLVLPPEVPELLDRLGDRGVLFDPPYEHQAQALELALAHPFRDLVVTTGTGSGKTETFLLPILGRLAAEAGNRVLPPKRSAARRVCASIPEPLSITDSTTGYASPHSLTVIEMAISVTPACSELSTSSATALDVPL